MLERARRAGDHLWRAVKAAIGEYGKDYCPQMAAAISYGVLFSVFPLAIVFVAVLGLVMQDDQRREEVTSWLLEHLPLSDEAGLDLAKAVSGLASPFSAAGLVAFFGLLWAASGMMAAIRAALTNIWDVEQPRSIVRGKLFDFLLVFAAGLLLVASFGVTILASVVKRASADASSSLGWFSDVVFAAGTVTAILLPLALTFVTFILLYHYVPMPRPVWRYIWPGALAAAVGAELLKTGYAYYLAYFADYNLVYGSLGAVIGFMFLVYLTATVFLFGAELSAALPATAPVRPGERAPRATADPLP
jgi:membrane protein